MGFSLLAESPRVLALGQCMPYFTPKTSFKNSTWTAVR